MPNLPLLLFGTAAILSGFIIFTLPETKGKRFETFIYSDLDSKL